MSFINALVNLPLSLNWRLQLREEFIQLDLMNIIIILQVENSSELNTQLDVFMEEMEEDNNEQQRVGIMYSFGNLTLVIP